jgi:hypothetical protein
VRLENLCRTQAAQATGRLSQRNYVHHSTRRNLLRVCCLFHQLRARCALTTSEEDRVFRVKRSVFGQLIKQQHSLWTVRISNFDTLTSIFTETKAIECKNWKDAQGMCRHKISTAEYAQAFGRARRWHTENSRASGILAE